MDYRRKEDAYFTNTRRDIHGLLPARSSSNGKIRILELGCGDGATLHWLKHSGYADETWGIELREDMANRAEERVDRVWSGDAGTRLAEIPSGSLQGILCLDVLEHLQDPWEVVDTLADKLVPGGWIIASIPNLRRLPVLWNLGIRGRFEYADSGIMDRTHLRFFTRRTPVSLLNRNQLEVNQVTETPHAPMSFSAWWNRFTMGLARDLVAEQYLVRAVKSGTLGIIALILTALCGYTRPAMAQSMPVGTVFWEDALRRGQLLGRLDSNVSFMLRPVDPAAAMGLHQGWGYDSLWAPANRLRPLRELNHWDTLRWGRWNIPLALRLLPLQTQSRRNGHHPYGWNDGPMVPSRGIQTMLSAGVYAKVGPLEMQYQPEMVYAQNKTFINPPFRARDIDMPERMGNEPYSASFPGQSFVKLRLGALSAGWSSENRWWGPGLQNALILSNNAPGLSHGVIHTNRPLRSRYGTFEGAMMFGNLHYSGYAGYSLRYPAGTWPPRAPDLKPDTLRRNGTHSYINAMQIVWQPSLLPGLFLGVSRVVQVKGYPSSPLSYLKILYIDELGAATTVSERKSLNRNQIIGVNLRYLFRPAHAEVYVELAREDHWWDLEDLITRPLATTVWMGGLRKLYPLPGKDRWIQFMGETTRLQAPMDNYIQPDRTTYSFYTHANKVGWTHRGQVMGSGMGPGSNMLTLGLTYGHGRDTWGLHYERVVYNEDLFYSTIDYLSLFGANAPNPFFKDLSKHFVDWGLIISHQTNYHRLNLGYRLHLLRTYNFQWNYEPLVLPGPFRFAGVNAWSLNLEVQTVYRF